MSRALLDSAELLLQAKNYSGSGNWLDESGNGHDATRVGSPTWDGTKFTLDGTDGFNVPDAASLNFTAGQSLTVLAIASFTSAALGSDRPIVYKLPATGGYALYLKSTGAAYFCLKTGGTASFATILSTLSADTVYAWAGRRDTVADTQVSDIGGFTRTLTDPTGDLTNTNYVGIGVPGSTPWKGDVYAVAIWRSALSDADLRSAIRTLRGKDASLLLSGVGG